MYNCVVMWFELKANDTKGLCKLILAEIQNMNRGYGWNINLVNIITTTKGKMITKLTLILLLRG